MRDILGAGQEAPGRLQCRREANLSTVRVWWCSPHRSDASPSRTPSTRDIYGVLDNILKCIAHKVPRCILLHMKHQQKALPCPEPPDLQGTHFARDMGKPRKRSNSPSSIQVSPKAGLLCQGIGLRPLGTQCSCSRCSALAPGGQLLRCATFQMGMGWAGRQGSNALSGKQYR